MNRSLITEFTLSPRAVGGAALDGSHQRGGEGRGAPKFAQVCCSRLQIAPPGAAAHGRRLEAPGAGLLRKGCRAELLGTGILGGRILV